MLRSTVSFALALLMLLPAMPTVHAAEYICELCKKTCSYEIIKQANCHEEGVVEYVCTTASCSLKGKEILQKLPKDLTNHDTICTDTGDGDTHKATCRFCTDYRNISEPHTFVNGYCSKCTAADYTQAEIVMPSSLELYVDLNDTQAVLSIGDVTMKVGNVDVSDNYTISFGWMDQTGANVSSSETYTLPTSVTSKVGDYNYGCFVVAMPKGITSGKFVSKSCTVTVHVRDLVSATAVVSSTDDDFAMDDTNNRTALSVAQQIYNSAYELTDYYPSYVVFGTLPESGVGILEAMASRYYFSPTGAQLGLSDLEFNPSGEAAGSYVVNFTVYDTKGNDFPGVLTIVVEHDIGHIDLAYITTKGENVTLNADDFQEFWQDIYSNGTLNLIYFDKLPTTREGILYYNYSEKTQSGTLVKTSDMFSRTISSSTQNVIDGITFVPDSKFTGLVTIDFVGYGVNNLNRNSWVNGTLAFFVSTGNVKEITYTVDSDKTLELSSTDFLTAYQKTVGKTDANFSIKLLDVPESGALYINYTGSTRDKALNAATISDYSFYYSSNLSHEISDLTYVAPTTTREVTDVVRYLACDSKGEFKFVGEIHLTAKPTVVVYTKYFPDVQKTASTEWFYTPVMDLAEAGVIGGFDDGTFKPQGEVTYAQALKLIMLAAGYPTPVQTGKHWASGYLAMAQANGLLDLSITESSLDLKIRRNDIAMIAAKALKLPAPTLTKSPFSDVVVGTTYAPYVFSLYEAGIITGSVDKNGNTVYYGINSITRAEMSVIVWRIMNYNKK